MCRFVICINAKHETECKIFRIATITVHVWSMLSYVSYVWHRQYLLDHSTQCLCACSVRCSLDCVVICVVPVAGQYDICPLFTAFSNLTTFTTLPNSTTFWQCIRFPYTSVTVHLLHSACSDMLPWHCTPQLNAILMIGLLITKCGLQRRSA